jgi:hypothetical protein
MPRPPIINIVRRCSGPGCTATFTPVTHIARPKNGTDGSSAVARAADLFCSHRCERAYDRRAVVTLADPPFPGDVAGSDDGEATRCLDCGAQQHTMPLTTLGVLPSAAHSRKLAADLRRTAAATDYCPACTIARAVDTAFATARTRERHVARARTARLFD